MKPPVLLSWSSGKDCAWALHILQQQAQFDVVALLTTFNEATDRVAMHGVSVELVEAQARSAGLPLWSIPLPWPCTNEIYERCMHAVVERALQEGIRTFAYGDLHLREIRAYREKQLAGTPIEPIFPIWDSTGGTARLAQTMIKDGLRAVVASVDPNQLDNSFVGREFDRDFLTDLPSTCDPCGERGEFHTFCYAGPMFNEPVPLNVGEPVLRDGYWFADLALRT
ncbi:ATPase [soil metagenome]